MKKTGWLLLLLVCFLPAAPAMPKATPGQWLGHAAHFQYSKTENPAFRVRHRPLVRRGATPPSRHKAVEEVRRPWTRFMLWGLALTAGALLLATLSGLTVLIPLFVAAGLIALTGLVLFGIGAYKWLGAGTVKSIAMIALLLGLLGLIPYVGIFSGPPAILFAVVALRSMRHSRDFRWDALAKFALAAAVAGLVLGLVLLLFF